MSCKLRLVTEKIRTIDELQEKVKRMQRDLESFDKIVITKSELEQCMSELKEEVNDKEIDYSMAA